jgi:hypothetical protein
VPIIKPAQKQIQHKTVQTHKKKTLNRQNINNMAGKSNINEILGQSPYTLNNINKLIKMPQTSAESVLMK